MVYNWKGQVVQTSYKHLTQSPNGTGGDNNNGNTGDNSSDSSSNNNSDSNTDNNNDSSNNSGNTVGELPTEKPAKTNKTPWYIKALAAYGVFKGLKSLVKSDSK